MTWLPLRLSWAWIKVTRRLRPPINAYYASDIMIEKVREIIKELEDIGDTVKSEDIINQQVKDTERGCIAAIERPL